MARFDAVLPNDLLRQIGGLADGGADAMMSEMLPKPENMSKEKSGRTHEKCSKSPA